MSSGRFRSISNRLRDRYVERVACRHVLERPLWYRCTNWNTWREASFHCANGRTIKVPTTPSDYIIALTDTASTCNGVEDGVTFTCKLLRLIRVRAIIDIGGLQSRNVELAVVAYASQIRYDNTRALALAVVHPTVGRLTHCLRSLSDAYGYHREHRSENCGD